MSRGSRDIRLMIHEQRRDSQPTSIKRSSPTPSLPLSKSSKSVREIGDSQFETTLEKKVRELNQELEDRSSAVISLQRNFEGLSNMWREERVQTMELRRVNYDFSETNKRLQKELDSAKLTIKKLEDKLRSVEEAKRTYDEAGKLINQLQNDISNVTQSYNHQHGLLLESEKMASVYKSEVEAHSKYRLAAESELKCSQKQTADLLTQVDELNAALNALKADTEGHTSKIDAFNERMSAKKQKHIKAKQLIEQFKQQLLDEKQGRAQTRKELTAAKSISKEQQEKIDRLEIQLEESRRQNNKLKDQLRSVQGEFQEQVYVLKQKDMTISETKAAEDRCKDLQTEIETLRAGQETLNKLIEQNNQFCNTKDAEIAELRNKLAVESVKISEINKNFDAKNNQVAEMTKELVSLKSISTEKDVQLEHLKRQNEANAFLQQLNEQYRLDLDKLRAQLAYMESETSGKLKKELEDTQEKLRSIEKTYNTLKATHDRSMKDYDQAITTAQKSEEHVLRLRTLHDREISELKAKLEKTQTQFTLQIENLKEESAQFKDKIEAKDKSLRQLSALEAQLANSEKIFEAKDSELKELISALNKEREKNRDLFHENHKLNQSQQELKEELAQLNPSENDLVERMQLLQDREKQLLSIIENLNKAEKSIESELQCHVCYQKLDQTATVIPCGHCYCSKCTEGYHPFWIKCGPNKPVKSVVPNPTLDALLGKIGYERMQIESAKKLFSNYK